MSLKPADRAGSTGLDLLGWIYAALNELLGGAGHHDLSLSGFVKLLSHEDDFGSAPWADQELVLTDSKHQWPDIIE